MTAPVQLPCDFCRAVLAPFGFAPAPRLGIPVRRPIKTCGAPGCNEKARARVAALADQRDPLSARRRKAAAEADSPAAAVASDPAQKSLF